MNQPYRISACVFKPLLDHDVIHIPLSIASDMISPLCRNLPLKTIQLS